MNELDIRDHLRKRPVILRQEFDANQDLHLLCPPEGEPSAYEQFKIALGPFTTSVLLGLRDVTLPARQEELQDLWAVVMREAMPTSAHREPGGEPVASLRTATLGWRLLALLGSAIELLAATGDSVAAWRANGQPTGLACNLGRELLGVDTRGAEDLSGKLLRFATAEGAAGLLGYPTEATLSQYVTTEEAKTIRARCDRSAVFTADIHSVAGSVVADPFWRTFVKWKHGAIGTSPGSAPLWLVEEPGLDAAAVETRLKTGIVVFDARGGPQLYVWPTERLDLVAYSQMALQVMSVTSAVVHSVLAYGESGKNWPLSIYELEPTVEPADHEHAAFEALAASSFRIAALARAAL